MIYRPLYREAEVFTPEFKMFMLCNTPPSFDSTSDAMNRRTRVIRFETEFKELKETDRSQPNQRVLDKSLEAQIPTWKYAFMGQLITGFKRRNDEGMDAPEGVELATEEYKHGKTVRCLAPSVPCLAPPAMCPSASPIAMAEPNSVKSTPQLRPSRKVVTATAGLPQLARENVLNIASFLSSDTDFLSLTHGPHSFASISS